MRQPRIIQIYRRPIICESLQKILPGTSYSFRVWIVMQCGLLEKFEHAAVLFAR